MQLGIGYKESIQELDAISDLKKHYEKWIWRIDEFPYPIWQFKKFERFHPESVLKFYKEKASSMRNDIGDKDKEFFNFCKTSILSKSNEFGSTLKDEIDQAEASVRFIAGTFFALSYSRLLLVLTLFLTIFKAILSMSFLSSFLFFSFFLSIKGIRFSPLYSICKFISNEESSLFLFSLILLFITFFCQREIKKRFRQFRLKEVDMVYDAFYLINEKPKKKRRKMILDLYRQ